MIFVSVLACSNSEKDVGYLNKLDSSVKNLDVLDDYESERSEIARSKGPLANIYSLGDHVSWIRCLSSL